MSSSDSENSLHIDFDKVDEDELEKLQNLPSAPPAGARSSQARRQGHDPRH